jgi:hypothetical protein
MLNTERVKTLIAGLERRLKAAQSAVDNYETAQSIINQYEVERSINYFMHFILSNEETANIVDEVLKEEKSRKEKYEIACNTHFRKIIKQWHEFRSLYIEEMKTNEPIRSELDNLWKQQHGNQPTTSLQEALTKFSNHILTDEEINHIISHTDTKNVPDIVKLFFNIQTFCDKCRLTRKLKDFLSKNIDTLKKEAKENERSHNFEIEYSGVVFLDYLCRMYQVAYPQSRNQEYGKLYDKYHRTSPKVQQLKKFVVVVYNILCEKLTASLAKRTVMNKLVSYAENYKREYLLNGLEKLRDTKPYDKEHFVHEFVNEFIFLNGYFPLIKPRTGNKEIDTLAQPPKNATAENSFILEVKQYYNTTISPRAFSEDIDQLRQYLESFQRTSLVSNDAYLLVLYGGEKGTKETKYTLSSSEKTIPNVGTIHIDLIYIGNATPSQKTKTGTLTP